MRGTSRLFKLSLFSLLSLLVVSCACPDGKTFHSIDGERVNELKTKFSKMTAKELEELTKSLQVAKEFLPKQVLVKFKEGTSPSKISETLSTLSASRIYQFKSSQALLLNIPSALTPSDVLAVITALNELKSVEYAGPNGIVRIAALPNDPSFPEQDSLRNTGQYWGTPGVDVRAEKAWDITRGSHDVIVGVIDTGIDYRHPDLVENMWTNPGEVGLDADGFDKSSNGVDDDDNGYVDDVHGYDFGNNDPDPMDDYGHGTHVAGIIGATGNNGVGITGVAWQVKMVALKFLKQDGSGTEADAARAIEYATQMNIPITNNSWGGLAYNQVLKDAIEANAKKGFLFIAAAGNSAVDNDIVNFFPANYEASNIISVAAVDNKDFKARFSNWGSNKVHIAAPGVAILSLFPTSSGTLLTRMDGTSMAAPHVAGAAALIKSAYPSLTFLEIKNRILFGADTLPTLLIPSFPTQYYRPDGFPVDKPLVRGGRRLNLEKSLELDSIPPGPIEGLQVSFTGLTQIEVQFQATGDDGGSGKASGYVAQISSSPLTSEAQWSQEKMIDLNHLQMKTGTLLAAEVGGLEFLQKGYLTLRAIDNAGNLGPLSRSVPFEMANPKTLFVSDGESYEGIQPHDLFSVTVPFGQEVVSGRGNVWSDSPYAPREYGYNYMEFTENIEVTHPDVVLQFDTKLDCEAAFERGEVEIRINEETDPFSRYFVWNPDTKRYDWFQSPKWRLLAAYSAPKCEWATVRIPLRNKLKAGDKVRFRFWFKNLGIFGEEKVDGWLIDDITLLGPGAPEKPSHFQAYKMTEESPYLLKWKDNSQGETRFEIRKVGAGATDFGTLFAETAININQFETGQTSIDSELRVRACNGSVCSEFSEPIQVLALPPRVQTLDPVVGPLSGGNALAIQGWGFSEGAKVFIEDVECPNSSRVSENLMTCNPASREPGTVSVKVVNPDSQESTLPQAYTYQSNPLISSVNPIAGPLEGGNTLVVTGSGFLPDARILIGSRECFNPVWDSSSQIKCTLGEENEGTFSVEVINSDGQRAQLLNAYTYQTAPTIFSVAPAAGPLSGGNILLVNGSDFLVGAKIQIEGVDCPNSSRLSALQMTCNPSARNAGLFSVEVINPDMQMAVLASAYQYQAGPRLESVVPLSGPLAGGNSITVNGADFALGASIYIQGIECSDPVWISSSQMTCTAPPRIAGTYSVEVVNPDAQESHMPAAYTYQPAPTILSVSPSAGPLEGGKSITLNGTGFLFGAQIEIEGVECLNPTRVSENQMTCTPLARGEGTYSVAVINPDGQQSSLSEAYTYQAGPTVNSVNPKVGPLAGGNSITVTGTRFLPGAKIQIEGMDCPQSVRVSGTRMTCTPPARSEGTYSLTVMNPDEQQGTLLEAYTYLPAPSIASINPQSGPLAGGNTISVTGSHFLVGVKIQIQGIDCPNTVRVSSTQMTCTPRSRRAGTYSVQVANPDGQQTTSPAAYTYQPAPIVSSVSPKVGPLSGGNTITVVGAHFVVGSRIQIQGADCPNVTRVSATRITCTPQARTAGTYHVRVINPDSQTGVLTNAYTYQPAPRISSISPSAGPLSGGNTLTVNGYHFLPGAKVFIQGVECRNALRLTANQLTCTLSARSMGTYSVQVIHPDSQENTLSAAYTYQPAPSLTSVSPSSGPTSGGNTITLQGSGFLPGAKVDIQGIECTKSTVLSSTQIRCTPAPRRAGTYHVKITNPDAQQGLLRSSYTYR